MTHAVLFSEGFGTGQDEPRIRADGAHLDPPACRPHIAIRALLEAKLFDVEVE